MEEIFTYDDMNRLTDITLKRPSGQDLYCSATYDELGRMTSKQAVVSMNGTPQVTSLFSLPSFDATKVHALSKAQTSEGVFPATPQIVTYTGFDKVSKVKQGNDSICYTYGYDRQRVSMEEHVGTASKTKQYWGACELVTETDGNTTSSCWRTFITGPYGVFAVVESRNGQEATYYVLKDNLGSWATITDENGTVIQRMSYDAWGNLRNPNTWANYTIGDTFDKPLFDHGYTGHEHLSAFGLVNMNGRMYDPVMSSFLSPDRFVQNPMTTMGFNRYAYCMNNPLRYVDPTGWEPRPGGGGNGDYPPGVPYYIDNEIWCNLAEVTILADNPSLSNNKERITYNTYYYGGSPTDLLAWGDSGNGQSVGPSNSGGCGGGSGNHGGQSNQLIQKQDVPSIKIPPTLHLVNSTMFTYDGIVWTNPNKLICIEAGQHVKVEVVNKNILGVQLTIQDITTYHYETNSLGIKQIVYSGEGYGVVLPPGIKASYDFYRFDYSPINWTFEFATEISEAVNVKINIYSEWKQGMNVDPNHPKYKKP